MQTVTALLLIDGYRRLRQAPPRLFYEESCVYIGILLIN